MLKRLGVTAKLILIALIVLALLHALAPRVMASGTDRYADQWFTFQQDASWTLEMRYTLLRSGARLYVRDTETDPGSGAVRSVVIGQFRVVCTANGTAPATVALQRVTSLDPTTGLPKDDRGDPDGQGVPVAVDVSQPLGKLVAITCAAHAYAVRTGH